ncbi:MAG: EAL domain-containing protein [Alphaproteobacteria bacterium]
MGGKYTNAQTIAAVNDQVFKDLKENNFFLVSQPVVSAKTGALVHEECLIRYKCPAGEVHPASSLIPFAEQVGIVQQLDLFAIKGACEHLSKNPDLQMSVNISRLSLDNMQIQTYLESATDVAVRKRLIIEITETAIPKKPDAVADFISFARQLNLKIALDDFGSGATLWDDLTELDIDIIKLDKVFAIFDESNKELLEKTLKFARARGIQTIAEGIESQTVADKMIVLGVNALQGYYLGKPKLLSA